MTKKLDNEELKEVTGAGQDPEARNIDRLEGDTVGGGGGDEPRPEDIQNPGLQDVYPE